MPLLNLHLKVWRQEGSDSGHFQDIEARAIPDHASFLEMMDIVNQRLMQDKTDPVAFDHDCREGICGACSMTINGIPHGPERATTTCQLHMRKFRDGDTIWIEPFRARSFPVIKDLIVDRSGFDRVIQSGGFVTVRTGSAPEANSILIGKEVADAAMDAAACIGCGACVAACKNASAMLFVSAKVSQLGMLPQGQPERWSRVQAMVAQMDEEGFGNCTNTGACEAECPKEISLMNISRMNNDFFSAKLFREEKVHEHGASSGD